MTTSAPLQGLLGGLSLSIPVFALLTNSGKVFGISGFLHRVLSISPKTRTWWEDVAGVLGLIGGGAFVGLLRPYVLSRSTLMSPLLLPGGTLIRAGVSGLLSGLGSKLQNGCTSGHMICGLSRFSMRSVAATAVFFASGVVTSGLVHQATLPYIGSGSWSLIPLAQAILFAEAIPMLIELGLAVYGASRAGAKPAYTLRILNIATACFHFALALQLSTLTTPQRVVSFLTLGFPSMDVFDTTLLWLSMGAIPLSIVLYRVGVEIARRNAGREGNGIKRNGTHHNGSSNGHAHPSMKESSAPVPLLGGSWSIPTNTQITPRLLLGAMLFGMGWALEGVCPGPALVNLGLVSTMVKSHLEDLLRTGTWLMAFAVGGLVVP